MTNGNLQRVRYFDRQLLRADDFKLEQEYHINKLTQLVSRFPYGIVRGLNVICDKDGFKIEPGLAVDQAGKAIVVGEEGLLVSVDGFSSEEPYLSLRYVEKEVSVGLSACDTPLQKNRIEESIEVGWRRSSNQEPWITVAKIIEKPDDEEQSNEKYCENHVIIDKDKQGREIRRNASLLQAEQIAVGAITEEKIKDGVVTLDKLAADIEFRPAGPAGGDLDGSNYPEPRIVKDAITSAKIAEWDSAEDPQTKGIITEHIRDGAVKSNKLSLINELMIGTLNPDEEVVIDEKPVEAEPNAIIQVIPTKIVSNNEANEGELSWTILKVKFTSSTEKLKYIIKIKNEGKTIIEYQIREIILGKVLEQ